MRGHFRKTENANSNGGPTSLETEEFSASSSTPMGPEWVESGDENQHSGVRFGDRPGGDLLLYRCEVRNE